MAAAEQTWLLITGPGERWAGCRWGVLRQEVCRCFPYVSNVHGYGVTDIEALMFSLSYSTLNMFV